MIRAESAERRVGCESGTLSLLVHFDAGRLPEQIPGRARRRYTDGRRIDVYRAHGLSTFGRCRDDGYRAKTCNGVTPRERIRARWPILCREREWKEGEKSGAWYAPEKCLS